MNSLSFPIPAKLSATCRTRPDRVAWLSRLPDVVKDLEQRWSLRVGAPFDNTDVSCAWVAPAVLADGTRVVLKLGMPHFEGEHEIEALRFLDGDPTVRLVRADDDLNAMLLEQCEPGIPLRSLAESEQDMIVAQLLRRLWRKPEESHPFNPLSAMTAEWSRHTVADAACWPDANLVRDGLRLFRDLPENATANVLLATDLHAGNVLRAQREPWLVIDPKPFVGDPAYDATQHLINCFPTLYSDPDGTIRRLSALAGLDHERVRLWTFARLAAEPREDWRDDDVIVLARALAP